MPNFWMVFDVESVGLHGEGFAVAWIVLDPDGIEHEASQEACLPTEATGPNSGRIWVRDNCPELPITRQTPTEIRQAFWAAWSRWKAKGAVLIADCGWPVEARFLAACVDDARIPAEENGKMEDGHRDFQGPYPLHELASLLLGAGIDPWRKPKRLAQELPEHDPLADTRLSVRQLLAVFKRA